MNILIKVSSTLYGSAMFIFGCQHFIYADFTATIVPAWIPWHMFWTCFVGVALIAAALCIITNTEALLACILLGCMLSLFILLIHVPLILNDFHNGGEITNAFKDIGLASGAFILAGAFKSHKMNVNVN